MTYRGSCAVPTALPPKAPAGYRKIWFQERGILVGESGPHAVSLYDMAGKRVWAGAASGPKFYSMAEIRARASLKAGVYLAKVALPAGEVSRPLSVF